MLMFHAFVWHTLAAALCIELPYIIIDATRGFFKNVFLKHLIFDQLQTFEVIRAILEYLLDGQKMVASGHQVPG